VLKRAIEYLAPTQVLGMQRLPWSKLAWYERGKAVDMAMRSGKHFAGA
jgi:hypothetical protein